MNDDSAFPNKFEFGLEAEQNQGLTKRELFAMAAMQGLISANRSIPSPVAKLAVEFADALLEELGIDNASTENV